MDASTELRWEGPGRIRLDRFLALNLPDFSRQRLAEVIDEGGALVDGAPRKRSHLLEPGAHVTLLRLPAERPPHDLTPIALPLDVVFEDDCLLIVNKPRGLAVHPATSLRSPSLVNALLARSHALSSVGGSYRPGIVHRLDKDTTGLLVVAKSDAVHRALGAQLRLKSAERRYFALVEGEFSKERVVVDLPLARDPKNRLRMSARREGKPARTEFKRLAAIDGRALLAVRLQTGRTHQIRAHCRAIGHPVVGDALYGSKSKIPLQLHAAYLEFTHPGSGERVAVYAEPPEDFLARGLVRREFLDPW